MMGKLNHLNQSLVVVSSCADNKSSHFMQMVNNKTNNIAVSYSYHWLILSLVRIFQHLWVVILEVCRHLDNKLTMTFQSLNWSNHKEYFFYVSSNRTHVHNVFSTLLHKPNLIVKIPLLINLQHILDQCTQYQIWSTYGVFNFQSTFPT